MAHGPSGLGSPTSENENMGTIWGRGGVDHICVCVCVCIH